MKRGFVIFTEPKKMGHVTPWGATGENHLPLVRRQGEERGQKLLLWFLQEEMSEAG